MKNYSGIILIIVAIGLFFVVIDPVYKQVQLLQETKRENDIMIVKAKELREKRTQLMDKYNSISMEQRDKLNRVLPETIDNIRLIADIDKIADNSAIALSSFTLGGDVNQESDSRVVDRTGREYGVIELGFSFSTDYENMKKFLEKLENSLRLVDIRKISVNAGSEDGIYSYSLLLNTYWLR